MGTITSGVGLISGLNIEQIVAQLIAIDARPRDRLLSRMTGLDAQRTALLDISARIAGILSRISSLAKPDIFSGTSLSSSNPDLLSVSGGQNTPVGSYSFIVRQLASTHQIVSRGFATRDGALPSGVITLESAKARVNNQTRLDELNGYAGVQRGKFKLTDDSGASATININDAVTLSEVVDRINDAGLNINAQIRGDRLVLTETTGGSLRISEVGGSTARDLGFAPGNTFSPDGELTGADLVFLSEQFRLSALNDANGVRRAKAGGDFNVATAVGSFKVDLSEILTSGTRIERLNHGGGVNLGVVRLTTTDADGAKHTHEVDLAGLRTVGEIKSAIETAVPDVRLNLVSNKLILSYADAGATRQLKIEDVSGTASRDLGILGESATGRITGREVLVIDRLQDVLLAVNFAEGNDYGIQATIDGKRLRIAGQDGGAVQLSAIGGS
ncbi:MAG TPA: flagellar cap protein FliD N-terminal domain-containing protein, partial [Phycisphaerae bacterium]|nr:flagellar cap protein FliD N-terminal domain-containing protein [Phycisphaerae bacterium]